MEDSKCVCHACGEPASNRCGRCKKWEFCSEECSDDMASLHKEVCHDYKSRDVEYLQENLAQTIVEMEIDVDSRYAPDEFGDPVEEAKDVLGVLYNPNLDQQTLDSAIDEAHFIIRDHLYDHAGQEAFSEVEREGYTVDPKHIHECHDWTSYSMTGIALDRISAKEEDELKDAKKMLDQVKNECRRRMRQATQRFRQAKAALNQKKKALRRAQRKYNQARRLKKRSTQATNRASKYANMYNQKYDSTQSNIRTNDDDDDEDYFF